MITPLPPSRQITTPHLPIDTTAATKEKIFRHDRCTLLISSVLHTTSYTISLIRVNGKIAGRRYFQYTAIDVASRWRHLEIYDEQTNHHSICFLKEVMRRFDYPIAAIKTDNHATFTNRYNGSYKREDLSPRQMHALDQFCAAHNIVHYLIDPGKPAQNGTVERSHREDQEKFYEQNGFKNLDDLERKLKVWNTYYNNLEHCGLGGKTPNEFLEDYKLIKPPNVLA